eukprot:6172996-Pleurochrysis_carterae.AAC.7
MSKSVSSKSLDMIGNCHGCSGATSGPRQREIGPMSRVISLYHAWLKACSSDACRARQRLQCIMGKSDGRVDRVSHEGEVGRQHHDVLQLRCIMRLRRRADEGVARDAVVLVCRRRAR